MTKWDKRYKRGQHITDGPHPLVVRAAAALHPGRALDLASGMGRHSLWLAERGWQVTAVDNSPVAMENLRQHSAEKGVMINSYVADLEKHEFVIEPNSCDGVGAQILTAPKVRSMRILTNPPCKLAALEAYGLKTWPKRR